MQGWETLQSWVPLRGNKQAMYEWWFPCGPCSRYLKIQCVTLDGAKRSIYVHPEATVICKYLTLPLVPIPTLCSKQKKTNAFTIFPSTLHLLMTFICNKTVVGYEWNSKFLLALFSCKIAQNISSHLYLTGKHNFLSYWNSDKFEAVTELDIITILNNVAVGCCLLQLKC